MSNNLCSIFNPLNNIDALSTLLSNAELANMELPKTQRSSTDTSSNNTSKTKPSNTKASSTKPSIPAASPMKPSIASPFRKTYKQMKLLFDINWLTRPMTTPSLRKTTLDSLYEIYNEALNLGRLPRTNQFKDIGINISQLRLYYDGCPHDPNSTNPGYYFHPMPPETIRQHGLLAISANDSLEAPSAPLPSPARLDFSINKNGDSSNLYSTAGQVAAAINWHFREGGREGPSRPGWPVMTLVETSLWYGVDELPWTENVFGDNPFPTIPLSHDSGEGWFVDKVFTSTPHGLPHLSVVLCHDHKWTPSGNSTKIDPADPCNSLLEGEIKVIMQALISGYSKMNEHDKVLPAMPIQIISVVDTRARILQAHYNGHELIVRRSNFLDPTDIDSLTGTEWYELFARYLAAQPVGDTTTCVQAPHYTPPPTPTLTTTIVYGVHNVPTQQPVDVKGTDCSHPAADETGHTTVYYGMDTLNSPPEWIESPSSSSPKRKRSADDMEKDDNDNDNDNDNDKNNRNNDKKRAPKRRKTIALKDILN
ncbi:hypothetical protein BJX64DRAFT_289014 [Aspergillus heterothallicus]